MSEITGRETGIGPKVVRRSPLAPRPKLCPRCLVPLNRGSKLGGWLIPQDYYCSNCGYRGTAYLESAADEEAKA